MSLEKDEWYTFSIFFLAFIVIVIIGHITKSFKEHFTSLPLTNRMLTVDKIKQANELAIERVKKDIRNSYKDIFSMRIPNFSDHHCKPECCSKSTALSCSNGCVCLNDEEIKMLKTGSKQPQN